MAPVRRHRRWMALCIVSVLLGGMLPATLEATKALGQPSTGQDPPASATTVPGQDAAGTAEGGSVQDQRDRRLATASARREAPTGTATAQPLNLAPDVEPHVAHIHADTCENLDVVIYEFRDARSYHVEPGTAQGVDRVELMTGTADVELTELLDEPFSIHVHENVANFSNYVACADIGGRPRNPWEPSDGLALELVEQANSRHVGIASLRPGRNGETTVTLALAEWPGEARVAAQPRTTYVDPAFGYEVAYDGGVWQEDPEAALEASADVLLTNGTSWVAFTATTDFGDDLRACVDGVAQGRLSDPRVRNLSPVRDESGEPVVGGTGAIGSYAIFDHDYAFPGRTEPYTLYVRCTPVSDGQAMLAVVQNVPTADYEEQAELREALFRGVTLPQ